MTEAQKFIEKIFPGVNEKRSVVYFNYQEMEKVVSDILYRSEQAKKLMQVMKYLISKGELSPERLINMYPELKDTEPYIYTNGLFFREDYCKNMYMLRIDKNNFFGIHNLDCDKPWTKKIQPSNFGMEVGKNHYFLTKTDFDTILRASGVSPDIVKLITHDNLKYLHTKIYSK